MPYNFMMVMRTLIYHHQQGGIGVGVQPPLLCQSPSKVIIPSFGVGNVQNVQNIPTGNHTILNAQSNQLTQLCQLPQPQFQRQTHIPLSIPLSIQPHHQLVTFVVNDKNYSMHK